MDLDYSPGSVGVVDEIVGRFHDEGLSVGQVGETVFGFGVPSGDGRVWNPVGKAFKLLEHGPEDSLFSRSGAAAPPGKPPSRPGRKRENSSLLNDCL
ncbi:hypothetical protein [Nonomuraea sp. NPDC005692]|uniref:hypothetical protein n=1 Tax=Nonomuraea sp. NPDC005692 TaxID=3157168 RepID=UPI003410A2AD